ncbi:hypothetical protein J2Z48_001752 [Croceifilum oryzae]|uniref:Uncharacterized protein n=1 Tax=Croceifilum oryzae TaxID=1553429 RepID=A0AAJ1TFN0_9BACL|nr:hypothetical protein [Croceifilum oryzae]MDQ0417579.1 hypothetical protein [Croceifilum oryzae]
MYQPTVILLNRDLPSNTAKVIHMARVALENTGLEATAKKMAEEAFECDTHQAALEVLNQYIRFQRIDLK